MNNTANDAIQKLKDHFNSKLTAKQRKALLICLAIIVASYILKWIYDAAQQAAWLQQQQNIRAAQARANAARNVQKKDNANAKPGKAKLPPRIVVTDLTNLEGTWFGQRLLNANGMCTLRLELRPVPETPGNYKGYSRLNCLPPAGLTSLRGGRVLPKQQRDNLNPVAMVLTGAPEDGALHFTLDKTVVAPNDDCETTEFVVTPFGTNQVALEWREGKCRGAQLILAKNGR
jgi:hypothetical protein